MMIFVYIIFLLSGIIKTLFIYYGVSSPVDITLLCAIILIFHIPVDIFINKSNLRADKHVTLSVFLLFIFLIWLMISLLYSRSETYSYYKALLFIVNIIAFIYPIIIRRFDINKFLRLLVLSVNFFFLWFYQIYFILYAKHYGTEMFYEVMGLYLTLATVEGLVVLVLITSPEKIFRQNIFRIFFIVISLAFLILSGARGPLLFTLLIIFFYYTFRLYRYKFKRSINLNQTFKIAFIAFPFVIVSVIYGIIKFYDKFYELLNRSIFRISLFINGLSDKKDLGESVDIRVDQIKFSFDSIFDNFKNFLLGLGFGSFGISYSGKDIRLYPHNILLEIWFELGLIGLLIFVLFLFSLFLKKWKDKRFITGFIILYIIMNMLKSSSIVDIRIFFTFFALFIISENIKLKKSEY